MAVGEEWGQGLGDSCLSGSELGHGCLKLVPERDAHPKNIELFKMNKEVFHSKGKKWEYVSVHNKTESTPHLSHWTEDLGQESCGIWGKEKRLSPSKNYQSSNNFFGEKFCHQVFCLKMRENTTELVTVGRPVSIDISSLGNSQLLTNTHFSIFPHLTCDPLPERINLKLTRKAIQ